MIKISEKQKDYLESKGFGFPEDLFHTNGKGKARHYYATESAKVLKALENYEREFFK